MVLEIGIYAIGMTSMGTPFFHCCPKDLESFLYRQKIEQQYSYNITVTNVLPLRSVPQIYSIYFYKTFNASTKAYKHGAGFIKNEGICDIVYG